MDYSEKTRARFSPSQGNHLSRKIDATTPPSLVIRLRDHADTKAWSEFVDVYSPLIYNYCRWRELQSSDAADVTQEVLLRVAKAIRSFEYDRTKGLFRDWLARIVLNEIRRLTKKHIDVATAPNDLDQDTGLLESAWNEQFNKPYSLKPSSAVANISLKIPGPCLKKLGSRKFLQNNWLRNWVPASIASTSRAVACSSVYAMKLPYWLMTSSLSIYMGLA